MRQARPEGAPPAYPLARDRARKADHVPRQWLWRLLPRRRRHQLTHGDVARLLAVDGMTTSQRSTMQVSKSSDSSCASGLLIHFAAGSGYSSDKNRPYT